MENVSAPKARCLEAIRARVFRSPLSANEAVSGQAPAASAWSKSKRQPDPIVTSCLYGVEEGLTVNTKSDRVLNVRRLVMELLLARCPESDLLQKMAKDMAVEPQARYAVDTDKGKCILCRSCVRVCEEVVGVSAIGLFSRGSYKEVGTPYNEKSDVCIGCGACVYVCPTGHIEMNQRATNAKYGAVPLNAACEKCGKFFAPWIS